MGREVKRVPLDFSWPLRQVWDGYTTPEKYQFPLCEACRYGESYSTGLTPEAYAVAHTFYPHMIQHNWAPGAKEYAERLAWHDKLGQREVDYLVAKGRLRVYRKCEPTDDNPRNWEWVSVPRTAAEVNAAERAGHLHDSINRMFLVEFRCGQLGIPEMCEVCGGHANIATPAQRAEAQAYEGYEPPEGEGWQLWENVTEGSPVSPVFAAAEELATWMVNRPDDDFDGASSFEVAMKFIKAGWAPSLIVSAGTGVITGVEAVGSMGTQQDTVE